MKTHVHPRHALQAAGVCLSLFAFVSGCQPQKKAAPAPKTPVVTILKPAPYPVQLFMEYSGNLEPVETVEIRARVRGFLTEVAFTEGIDVEKGAKLFRIDPREYDASLKKAKADKLKAAADLKRTKAEEDRAKRLMASRTMSEEEYQQKIAARETSEADLKQAEASIETAQLQLDYCTIDAPISGRIGRAIVTGGNLVGQNEPTLLATIVAVDPLHVYFDVPEKDLIEHFGTANRQNRTAPITVAVAREKTFEHKGEIDFLDNRVDPASGTVRMRGRLPNPKSSGSGARSLYPGLYARVRVPVGAPENRLVIPEEAVMTGQEGRFVFVLDDKDIVTKRTIVLGPIVWRAPAAGETTNELWSLTADGTGKAPAVRSVVSVVKGLKPEDRLVAVGLQRARPGAAVKPETIQLVPPKKNAAPSPKSVAKSEG